MPNRELRIAAVAGPCLVPVAAAGSIPARPPPVAAGASQFFLARRRTSVLHHQPTPPRRGGCEGGRERAMPVKPGRIDQSCPL